MCLSHWRMVPMPLQKAVWEAWKNFGAFTEAHNNAKESAIRAVAQKEGNYSCPASRHFMRDCDCE